MRKKATMRQRDLKYFEEAQLGKTYDLRLLRRLLPFLTPYRLLIAVSLGLVLLITVVELSLPFITKIAIDRFIVPRNPVETASSAGEPAVEPSRQPLQILIDSPEIEAVVRRYPERFTIEDGRAAIAWSDLSHLPLEDVKTLREKHREGLAWITIAFLLLVLADFFLNFWQRLIMETAGHRIMHDLRMRVFSQIQGLSLGFFNRNPSGRLVTRATNDVQNMHELFTSVLSLLFKDLFLLAGIMGVLAALNWRLALATFTVLPLVVLAAVRFSRRARPIFRALRVQVAEINTRFSETLGGIRVLQGFSREAANFRRFSTLNHDNYRTGMEQIHVLAVFMPMIEVLGVVTVAVIIYYGGLQVLSAALTLGTLVAFISYLRMFFRPIRDLSEKYNILQNAMTSAERLFLILDSEDRLPIPPSSRLTRVAGGTEAVVFDNVSFSYVPGEPVLRHVSFAVEAGKTVALVGPTGAGKTSIIHLTMRFYLPSEGRILVNGRDIRQFHPAELRSRMALVLQDPFLFSGTVRENIFPAGRELEDHEIRSVLEASNCRFVIDRLPAGIDTVLGEGGRSLSSGERQLISIARAFARSPEILLLDEATSYVDSATEARIQEALARLMEGRTTFVAAHRLSTIRKADRILVIRDGRIVEAGNHESLLTAGGLYARLHAHQK
ncbi:MAG: ABC transporter ATP-binding protein [Desulfobacterales bacterium]